MTTHTFAVGGEITLQLRIAHGDVVVEAVDDLAEASVTVRARHAGSDALERITVEFTGSELLVRAPRRGGIFDMPGLGRFGRDEVDVLVRVPAGSRLQLMTNTAPLTVRGRCGDADIAFGGGEASFEHVDGDLRARYGSGTVRAVRVSGRVELRSGSGEAKLGEVLGAVAMGCGSGSVEVQLARSTVRARTGSGSIRIGAANGDLDLTSGSGSLHIGLPAGVTARLDVTSGSGDVRSDLPIEQAPRSTSGKAIKLRARAGSGRVRVFRAA